MHGSDKIQINNQWALNINARLSASMFLKTISHKYINKHSKDIGHYRTQFSFQV